VADENHNGMAIVIKVPQIQGMKNEAKQKEINEKFIQRGKVLEEETRKTEEGLKGLEGMELHAEGIMNFEVKWTSENVLSILIDQYVYSGGAHGISVKMPFNYDLKQDKELTLADVFADANYVQELSAIVKENVAKSELKNYMFEDFKQIKPNEKFYLTKDHVVLVFDMYEYTAGAAGSPEVKMAKPSLPILKNEYK
jgi:hypothetical protein